MQSFWKNLPQPFFAMAPMADVTDVAFRALVAARGAPDIFWTEFVSADGLYHTREIQKIRDKENPLMRDLLFKDNQRPIVAQVFSSSPEMVAYATKLFAQLGFDGIDLNMGCPDKSIEKQGCGSAMIQTPKVAHAIIRAAQEASDLPVSVKTRVGYGAESLDTWLPVLLETSLAAITLHLRTRKEMSLVPADWKLMQKAVKLRNQINPKVLLIGNGDIANLEEGKNLVAESGCDGVMIGRAMFGNPWIFSGRNIEDVPLSEKITALIELAEDFETLYPTKHFMLLKKHFKAFITSFDGAAELRAKLMKTESATELRTVLDTYLRHSKI